MFAANSAVKVFSRLVSEFDSHLHKLAYTDRVETRERIGFVNLSRIVGRKELARVVTRESEGHLRKVVGTEAEELGFRCDFVCRQCRSRDFDHRAYFIFEVNARFFDNCVCSFDNGLLAVCKFLNLAYERDHDFGNDVPIGMTFLNGDSRFDDSLSLHNGDFGISYRKTATSVTHHRVELVKRVAKLFDFGNGFTLSFC